jgi:uncharacterized repeat protein (TIGR03803 family)
LDYYILLMARMKETQKVFSGGLSGLYQVLILTLSLSVFVGVCPCRAQEWLVNGTMLTSRWGQTATELTNGDLLIAGGTVYNDYTDDIFLVTNDAEIYDPNTGIPTITGFMNDERSFDEATRLPNGQVLVMGGAGDATSETYDPASGSWVNFVSMNDEREYFISVLLTNGTVLAAGGFDDNNLVDLNSAEVYAPGSATWTSVDPMPYAADTFAAVMLTNGTVLVCGGNNDGGPVSAAAIYYPKTQAWSSIASMNEPRAGHSASLLPNGQVLVAGGAGDQTTEIYDPGSAAWSYGPTMNDYRTFCYAVTLTNRQILVSGDNNTDVEIYDPVQQIWSYTASLPYAGFQQTETAESNGQVVVTGGDESEFNGPGLNIVETFSLTLGTGPNLDVSDSPTSGLAPLAVHFTSPSMDDQGNLVTNWSWNFGDGYSSSAQNPIHTYTNSGTYTPALIAYSTYGGTPLNIEGLNTVTVTNPVITVSFVPSSGAVPLTVQFASPGVDSLGDTITNWNWNFGDGATSTAQSPEHIYITTGGFSPSLVAKSTHGNSPLTVYGLGLVTVTNSPNPYFRVLYSLPANSGPNGGLVLADGVLYGTTINGGTVFAVSTNGLGFTNLFVGLGRPEGGLVQSGATLYGTAYVGGTNGFGGVFAINTNGTGYTNIYSFSSNPTGLGQEPAAGPSLAGGVLFGTTQYGGYADDGVVFALNTNGTGFSDEYAFSVAGGDYRINGDGDGPFAKVIFANGWLYGTTEAGGTAGDGVVFAVATNNPGSFTVLHYFASNMSNGTNYDGAFPFAGLLLAGNTLYGTTAFGGVYGNGSVFAMNTNGNASTFTNLYSFTGGLDGASPMGEVIISGGTLYGTATGGGASGDGVIFSISTNGIGFQTLYSFTGGNDGSTPKGALTLGANVLYGATTAGGAGPNAGAIFSYTLSSLPSPVSLIIKVSGANVILTWPANATGYTLQATPKLNPTVVWTNVTTAPTVISGLNYVTNLLSGSARFYRLSQ